MATRTISPLRLMLLGAGLVVGLGMALSVVRGGALSVATLAQGLIEALMLGLVALPFAAMLHLLGGGHRASGQRAAAAWTVVVAVLLLLLSGTGGLIKDLGRFGGEASEASGASEANGDGEASGDGGEGR
jgi:hypothetical protein